MMFANLVESNSHKGDYARSGKFFFATLTIYALAFLAIGVGSIYAYNIQVENNNLELTSLVTPIDTSEVQMLRVRPAARSAAGPSSSSRVAVVRSQPTMVTMDSRVIPDKVSVSAPTTELPTGTDFRVGVPKPGDNLFGGQGDGKGNRSGGTGTAGGTGMDELVRDTPPPPMKKEVTKPAAPPPIISKGVINGNALQLPKPAYSAIAKAAHASGTVTVQVLIDESGKVISARALSGHPLLLQESVQAAYRARFTPTLLSNQPVKVSGVITYNFVMQ